MSPIGCGLDGLVLMKIKAAYFAQQVDKTKDCARDMVRAGLFEADVEKVISEATEIEKAICAKSQRASNPLNTHYVIHGVSTKGKNVYCKICSNYDPITNEFVEWKLTSFEDK